MYFQSDKQRLVNSVSLTSYCQSYLEICVFETECEVYVLEGRVFEIKYAKLI